MQKQRDAISQTSIPLNNKGGRSRPYYFTRRRWANWLHGHAAICAAPR